MCLHVNVLHLILIVYMHLTLCTFKENYNVADVCPNIVQESLDKADPNILHQDNVTDTSNLHIINFGDDSLVNGSHLSFSKIEDNQYKSPILKTKCRTLKKCNIPRKKLRLCDSESKSEGIRSREPRFLEHSSFYGLSDGMKKVIQEVKGISELYRKFA